MAQFTHSSQLKGHTFHIPVMGTGFSVDTPIRVARYGISSVISIVDDSLMEQMRRYHCEKEGVPYEEIPARADDARAKRTCAYLNLVDDIVRQQVKRLQSSPFEAGSEITKYYDMLPQCPLKELYRQMMAEADLQKKEELQKTLRKLARPGSIDVNIMTKVDRDVYKNGEKLPPENAFAMSTFRGYATSQLASSIVFSAGMNPRLFAYMNGFEDFFPNSSGQLKKKIILKVSDFRSASVQGKYLAKRGLWVSEYRIESGINCGGHAFVAEGNLMGPILQEFKEKRAELTESLYQIYVAALEKLGKRPVADPLEVMVTVQGGITTHEEHDLLLEYYQFDRTGWGTPFLLVPEATHVDETTLQKLLQATDDDVYLSQASPLGVPFWNLRHSASEEARRERIRRGCPGSRCSRGAVMINTEFTQTPICTASRTYQIRKLRALAESGLPEEELAAQKEAVLSRSCICRDLAGAAELKLGLQEEATPAICPGPSIAYFSKIATLEEMVGHIYGRLSLLKDACHPHMFIKELKLTIDRLHKEIEEYSLKLSYRPPKYFHAFRENVLRGIEYYRGRAESFFGKHSESFLRDLKALKEKLEEVCGGLDMPALPAQ